MEWYWCLTHERAETDDERDDLENSLGPYPTEVEARHWRDRVEARNEAWEEQDRRWRGEDDDEDDD